MILIKIDQKLNTGLCLFMFTDCNRKNLINNSSLSLCLQSYSHQCTGQSASIKSQVQYEAKEGQM